jgi:hypothetical protein
LAGGLEKQGLLHGDGNGGAEGGHNLGHQAVRVDAGGGGEGAGGVVRLAELAGGGRGG